MKLIHVGALIRKRRKDLGLTVRQAAALIDKSKATWSAVENGAGSNVGTITEMAQALGMDLEVLDASGLDEARIALMREMRDIVGQLEDRDVEFLRRQLKVYEQGF